MPYIYKYTDKNDGLVKYVGIIRNDTNFPRRFTQHWRDEWFSKGDWQIEYCEFPSVSDVEALEGHFITIYGSAEWYNKAKATWGRLSFLPEIKWQEWNGEQIAKTELNTDFKFKRIRAEVYDLQRDIEVLDKKADRLLLELKNTHKEYDKQRRRDIRAWFRSNFALFFDGGYRATASELYDHYIENTSIDSYLFHDVSEFWEAFLECEELNSYVSGDTIYHIYKKDSDEYRNRLHVPEELFELKTETEGQL